MNRVRSSAKPWYKLCQPLVESCNTVLRLHHQSSQTAAAARCALQSLTQCVSHIESRAQTSALGATFTSMRGSGGNNVHRQSEGLTTLSLKCHNSSAASSGGNFLHSFWSILAKAPASASQLVTRSLFSISQMLASTRKHVDKVRHLALTCILSFSGHNLYRAKALHEQLTRNPIT